MKITTKILVAAIVPAALSTSAYAAKFQCGIWVNGNHNPSATGEFDTDSSDVLTLKAGDFTGHASMVLDHPDEDPSIAIVTTLSERVLSAAIYPTDDKILYSLLVLADDSYATTACSSGEKLVRPKRSFKPF